MKKTKQCDELARIVSTIELDQKHLKEKLYDFYQTKKTKFDPVDFGIDRVLSPYEEMQWIKARFAEISTIEYS